MDKTLITRIIIILAGVGVMAVIAFGYNYFGADLESLPRETTVVEKVFHQTEYETRRVGKYTTQRYPREVYYLRLRRPDGHYKNVKVRYELYNRASRGDTVMLPIGPGRLGWEICDAEHLTLPHPRKRSPRRHCRFVGTSGEKISADSLLRRINAGRNN